MPITAIKTAVSPIARTFVILCGAVLWAVLFAFVGSLTQRAWTGAACGTVIGAIIGYGFTKNLIGRVVVWVSVMGLLGAVVGPGYDADACTSAVGWAVMPQPGFLSYVPATACCVREDGDRRLLGSASRVC